MPTKCGHYAHLSSRFAELCAKFLDTEIAAEIADPATFSPDLDKLAAFRLLFHAEVETFLESKALDQLMLLQGDIGSGVWHRQHPQILSLYLIVRNFIQKVDGLTDVDLRSHYCQVLAAARARIKDSNGIKADTFTFLSVAAGKSLDEIDTTLLSTLNSYGKNRGDVAHASVPRVRSLVAPSAEKAAGGDIIMQLAAYYDVVP